MHAHRDLFAAVVKVMRDPVAGDEYFRLTQADLTLGLALTVVPLVNRELAANGREDCPTLGVRMLRVLRAHRPEKHSRVQPRRIGRRHRNLKLTLEYRGRDREIFGDTTRVEFARREQVGKTIARPFG